MKIALILSVAIASSLPAVAMANEKLAQDKQCFGCHTTKPDGAAPSFQKISQHWKGNKDAEAKLVAIIRQGSAATAGPHWNKATMPDQAERPLVSEAEARQIAKWVLGQ
ncbi:c-type cytochrome [Roseateles oligotrophus]|uniref:C-type cytochrome n=1 Tax=Roseateles oligotrophus TaxID=1769250 RepID=A0ABT2YIF6_9BURK|nr:c-type cytochrome [Roseateles oligotrophus]MCV2369793.1 c-type cytochrome [Roseateles oligotrophus]